MSNVSLTQPFNLVELNKLDDDVILFKNHVPKDLKPKKKRLMIMEKVIVNGNLNLLSTLIEWDWFKGKWFGLTNRSWFRILFENGTNNICETFEKLVSLNKLTTENVLYEIITNNNIFIKNHTPIIDYLIENIQYVDNDLLLVPFMLLLFQGHLTVAKKLNEHFEMHYDMPVHQYIHYSIVSKEGCKIFLDIAEVSLTSPHFYYIIYKFLFEICPNDIDIVNTVLEYSETIDFTHWIINNILIDMNRNLPISLVCYDHMVFKKVREYFQENYYTNMPMKNSEYLDMLIRKFPQFYRKIRIDQDDNMCYYLMKEEQPFVEENFNEVLNDFLDIHRVVHGEIECQICYENIDGMHIQCCLSETFSQGHVYCEDCIKKWLNPEKRCCPICRSELL